MALVSTGALFREWEVNQTVVQSDDEPDRHLVDVNNLPRNALSAILQKLSEKTQRSTQVYRENYTVSIGDVRNLIEKLRQEFHDNNPLSETLSVSLHLSSNQRFDFTSWLEFENFDTSQAERTKSLSFEYSRAFEGSDGTLERYKVQVSCQNINNRINFYFGPITISRVEDAGLPPVPIHASVSYSNYIRGKNLTGTVDAWVRSLDVESGKPIKFLQKHSGKLPTLGKTIAAISAILGCLSIFPENVSTVRELGLFLGYSALFVYCSYCLSFMLASFLERQIDNYRPKSMITLTKGDENRNRKLDTGNAASVRRSIYFSLGLLLQIGCSLSANFIYSYIPL